MAVSDYQVHSWKDDYTIYLSQLYTLYSPNISLRNQLCDRGYVGYPDPKYEGRDGTFMPDILSFSDQGDVQHIEIVCQELNKSDSPDEVRERIGEIAKYDEISDEMVTDYLNKRNHPDFSPVSHELVAVIPDELIQEHQAAVIDAAAARDIIVWALKPNGAVSISKEQGEHNNMTLEKAVGSGLQTSPHGNDLLQFTRKTDSNLIKFEFTQRLLSYCAKERKREFTFDEVDEVMIDQRPPMLWQLTEEEREGHWRDCLYAMLERFNVIEQTESSTYRWRKKKLLKEPRHQNRVIDSVAEKLGLD
ncbi:hypothetical protein [Natronomonas gomsonensis]|uniref:hypothetical protein n=1 Tax=Natronomonas gomsonensis TaxID=1046043 RepID=UPI0015BB134C|nr:hypothetical protein [Natronomonas gomsonensis]